DERFARPAATRLPECLRRRGTDNGHTVVKCAHERVASLPGAKAAESVGAHCAHGGCRVTKVVENRFGVTRITEERDEVHGCASHSRVVVRGQLEQRRDSRRPDVEERERCDVARYATCDRRRDQWLDRLDVAEPSEAAGGCHAHISCPIAECTKEICCDARRARVAEAECGTGAPPRAPVAQTPKLLVDGAACL